MTPGPASPRPSSGSGVVRRGGGAAQDPPPPEPGPQLQVEVQGHSTLRTVVFCASVRDGLGGGAGLAARPAGPRYHDERSILSRNNAGLPSCRYADGEILKLDDPELSTYPSPTWRARFWAVSAEQAQPGQGT